MASCSFTSALANTCRTSTFTKKYSHKLHFLSHHSVILHFSTAPKILKKQIIPNAKIDNEETDYHYSDFKAEESESESESSSYLIDVNLLKKLSIVKDADEASEMMSEYFGSESNVDISAEDCNTIISTAFSRNNVALALSVFEALRRVHTGYQDEKSNLVMNWKWPAPNINTYATVIRCLTASLQVTDAVRIVKEMACIGVAGDNEVTFGNIVKCPQCMIPIAVVLPQDDSQLVLCSKCRYQYQLTSGTVTSIESDFIRFLLTNASDDTLPTLPRFDPFPGQNASTHAPGSASGEMSVIGRTLRFLQFNKKSLPVAAHSVVVRSQRGYSRSYRFGMESSDLPVQPGERVTIAFAAPSSAKGVMGLLNFSGRTPGRRSEEPMGITNHASGVEFQLLRAPNRDSPSSLDFSFLVYTAVVLAGGDAATRFIEPSLPQILLSAAASLLIVGVSFRTIVLPKISKFPENVVETLIFKQKLLSQYDYIQSRLKELVQSAEEEVWMLARMHNIEKKIATVGEPSYSARKSRVQSTRKKLEDLIVGRLKLIDSYAKLASMIEIEVELDKDVIAAEAITKPEGVAERIEQLMELETLETQWRIEAEAYDEVEKLFQSATVSSD